MEELLNNAIKHSNAERVSLNVWETEENINIDYIDDGEGFNYNKALNKGQIGLNVLITQIKHMNGLVEFFTNKPKKVQIYITLPR
ncbi:ATP-binding protein [Oceanobacillus locisalsi]|uniref:ATP-binding protein n=1 Tax=Oceanobacillus locisalsi TaxID=546107 RepID=A0ABW3NKN7_9BACI